MNIQSISKEKRTVTLELDADDLVRICNAMYGQFESEKDKEKFLELYSDMMMVRDLCQYGHVDNFCLQNIVKCRNGIGNGLDGLLSDEDIDTFNAYLANNDIPTAFGNTDWMAIYKKIVGEHGRLRCGEQMKQWMQLKDD